MTPYVMPNPQVRILCLMEPYKGRVMLHALYWRIDMMCVTSTTATMDDLRSWVKMKSQTDIPEHASLGSWWDTRARRLGATLERPVSTAAEENLLCYSNDPYQWVIFKSQLIENNVVMVRPLDETVHQCDIDIENDDGMCGTGQSEEQCSYWIHLNPPCMATSCLTHWGGDNIAAVSQTTFSNAFSWIKCLNFAKNFTEICS